MRNNGESNNPNSQAIDALSENLSAAGHAMKVTPERGALIPIILLTLAFN
jgi:hypothetical protein